MRIAVNLTGLGPGKMGGMEQYIRGLLQALLRIDRSHRYLLITAPHNDRTVAVHERCEKIMALPDPPGRLMRWSNALSNVISSRRVHWIGDLLDSYDADLLFCPFGHLDPVDLSIPSVATIYDLQHRYYPFFFRPEQIRSRDTAFGRIVTAATEIITISHHVKTCLLQQFGADAARVHPIWIGLDELFFEQQGRADQVAAAYGLLERYAFYPANLWHHKNHALLIMAFALFRKRYNVPLKLVLTGVTFEGAHPMTTMIRHFGLEREVRLLGYVKREDLPYLYDRAACLIFPSLFEGFGIPPLEAMARGCPVVASRVTSLPEVLGDAALYIDPRDPDDIAEAMFRVVDDTALRETLVSRGHQRIARFSWEECAKRHLEVFELAYSRAGELTVAARARPFVSRHLVGLHGDRWVGKRLLIYLKGVRPGSRLCVGGSLLPRPYFTEPVTVTIRADATAVQEDVTPGAAFSLTIPITRVAPWITVTIQAGRTCVPKQANRFSQDLRYLSFKLDHLSLIDHAEHTHDISLD